MSKIVEKIIFQHEYRRNDFLHFFRGLSVQVRTAVRTVRTVRTSVHPYSPYIRTVRTALTAFFRLSFGLKTDKFCLLEISVFAEIYLLKILSVKRHFPEIKKSSQTGFPQEL